MGRNMLKGKIEELFERLERDGRLTVLPQEQVAVIDQRIRQDMTVFRQELAQKDAQSYDDTARIVLNA